MHVLDRVFDIAPNDAIQLVEHRYRLLIAAGMNLGPVILTSALILGCSYAASQDNMPAAGEGGSVVALEAPKQSMNMTSAELEDMYQAEVMVVTRAQHPIATAVRERLLNAPSTVKSRPAEIRDYFVYTFDHLNADSTLTHIAVTARGDGRNFDVNDVRGVSADISRLLPDVPDKGHSTKELITDTHTYIRLINGRPHTVASALIGGRYYTTLPDALANYKAAYEANTQLDSAQAIIQASAIILADVTRS